MEYQIVTTLGPASESEATWQALLEAGATGFRLNTSHLSLEQLQRWLARLEAFRGRVPVVLDLQGSKWRLGEFPACTLGEGQSVRLVCAAAASQPNVLPVPHPDFFRAAGVSGDQVSLNDGRVQLRVEAATVEMMTARVITAAIFPPERASPTLTPPPGRRR